MRSAGEINANADGREQITRQAITSKLQRRYVAGRVPGDALVKARWNLSKLDNIFSAVQTVAGCPENWNFCSVWVTDGRQPRQRLTRKIIEEVNELYESGFRYVISPMMSSIRPP